MSIFSSILELVEDVPANAPLRERVARAEAQHNSLNAQVETLKRENSVLGEQNAKLTTQLAAKSRPEEFVEHKGALFKRKADGTFHEAAYCPNCRKVAGAIDRRVHFSCRCGWHSNFKGYELEQVIKGIPTGV